MSTSKITETIHLRRRQIFMIYDPSRQQLHILMLSAGKFGQSLTPPLLENSNVLNG